MDNLLATHCRDRAEVRHERVCSPSQCLQVQDLPISPVEIREHHHHTSLSVDAGSRPEILHLLHGVQVLVHCHLSHRRGAARWFFELCGNLWARKGRVGEL